MTSLLPDLHLTERRPRLCRLAPDEAAFLIERHRAHLETLPTPRRHIYQLTPAGVAGVLSTPRRRIVISPKLPLANLLLLLDPLAEVPATPDFARPADGGELLDVLAGQLARLMHLRAAAGLHRGYQEEVSRGQYLAGRLDLAAQLRQAATRRDQIHSRKDDFTADLPCNLLPRALAANLASAPFVSEPVRVALRQALAGFLDVAEVPLTPDLLARLGREPAPEAYRPLLDLCRLLAEALAPGLEAGPTRSAAFLLCLERLFEVYITRAVLEANASTPLTVSVQRTHLAGGLAAGTPPLEIRPDVSVDEGGRPVLVVDAKWKRLPATPVPEDVYQVIAYAGLLDARQAVLVYPGKGRRVWNYALPGRDLRVQVRTLDVAAAPEVCRRRWQQLGRALRRLSAARAG